MFEGSIPHPEAITMTNMSNKSVNKSSAAIKALCTLLCACVLCALCAFSTAEGTPPVPPYVTVNDVDVGAQSCFNADGALCIQLKPVAQALGYQLEENSVEQDGICRYVLSLTPPQPASADQFAMNSMNATPLMVAYTVDSFGISAVAVSKDQMLLPLKQSMTLVDGEPYMPTEFYVTGMCASVVANVDANSLNIVLTDSAAAW